MRDSTTVGERVRELRLARGLSQRELAGSEMSASYVSLLEAGKRRPTAEAVLAVCRTLGVQPSDLGADDLVPTAHTVRPGLELDLKWAKIALRAGNPASAEKYARLVFDSPDADDALRTEALALLAAATEGQGRVREAIEMLDGLDERLDPDEGRALWLSVQTMLLRCYKTAGDYAYAISVGERAMARFGDRVGEEEMMLVISLADAHTERGDFTRAQMYLTNILSRAEQSGSLRVRGAALWNASIVASEEGRDDDAVQAAEQALALLGESDATRNLGRLHANLGYVLLERGGPGSTAKARTHLDSSLELVRDEGPAAEVARIVLDLARCDLAEGDAALARSRVQEARTMLDEADQGAEVDLALADLVDAHVASALGEVAQSLELALKAAETTERLESSPEAARVWAAVADLARGIDDDLCLRAMTRSMRAAGVRPTRFDVGVAQSLGTPEVPSTPASKPAPAKAR